MDEKPIEGTLNFRAVASYRSARGRLKPGGIYRSGAFDDIGDPGVAHLRRIGLKTIFDLRSNREKARSPSPLLAYDDFCVVTEAHDMRSGELGALLADPAATQEACRNVMKAIYARLPIEFTTVFRLYFRTAAETSFPLAVHCTAGKDRTGIVVALMLDLLGVSRDDIMEDYLRTNEAREQLSEKFRRRRPVDFGNVADHLVEPVISAEPDYLHAMFAAVKRDFCDTRGYAAQVLALSDADLERLRRRLLE